MQYNSKINTVLLVVLILLVGFGIWKLSPGMQKNSGDSRKVLSDLISKNPNGTIKECSYEGMVYFSLDLDSGVSENPYQIYDSSGKVIASGGGFVFSSAPIDPLFTKINPTCTKLVYQPESLKEQNQIINKNTDISKNKFYLTDKENKTKNTILKGNTVFITLGNPGDGGYQFENPIYDKTLFVLKNHTHKNPAPSGVVGDFGTDTWEFLSVKKGTSNIVIDISRPWDKSNKINDFTSSIIIN